MANIKSAKKRILVNETKAARNKAIKSKVKTCVKKVETAVTRQEREEYHELLKILGLASTCRAVVAYQQ